MIRNLEPWSLFDELSYHSKGLGYPLRVMKANSVVPAFADNSSQFLLKSGGLACASAAAATAAQ